ncbi:cytochrome ubiquinol oxidase subunit I [Prauserella muralis]|uniref:Cytochrome BD ubiquinol oxidase subunit I n=1 Tax=Prauserella muralis TaxID=588067 RepID=A0A2V4B193_9PSEU|nr:cytochrome ubiquinol oxidase subunit I [Prauserella muralis]PXY22335.1 cytochrome BD ubiquinol oxidase subunit I [Prauserella muralis]TWE27987.1 cytochrome bd-I ubiquinol oxidase subunit 1 apoprotein [Prauserella muralis]
MNALDLARWQFGITTVYHFIFVPLTIGLSLVVAIMQTMWVRTGRDHYLRMTKFWGKLFLINFAMGVVTGIVQEFQFGMNWSDYSRFVGDIFGAPLAIEGLLAFFMESTFLGLWIFGWNRLPKRVHLATIWAASIGTMLSAYFILAANSWMQHPVGYTINEATGRPELNDFGAVLTNPTVLVTFPHTMFASFLTAAAVLVGISAWHLRKRREVPVYRPSMLFGLWLMLVSSVGVVVSGDLQARVMTEQQPMKMAAAEALYDSAGPASFSLFTIGSLDGSEELFSVRVPGVLSFMATGALDGRVEGINDLQRQAEQQFGPGDYTPNVPIAYWSFRVMVGFGFLMGLLAIAGLWAMRRGRLPGGRWFYRAAIAMIAAPFVANSVGWIFTEMARQPWVVYGVLRTADGVSPSVAAGSVLTSMVVFTVLYGVLAVVDGILMYRYAKAGPPQLEPQVPDEPSGDTKPEQPVFAY